jgi:DDE family transposase
VSRINTKRLKRFALHQLGLQSYLDDPGEGRLRPQIPAATMLWALLIGQIVRRSSYHGVEELVRSPARVRLEVSCRFSDDSLGYCTERLQAAKLRAAIVRVARGAKRNKAFENSRWIGLALDGTGAGHVTQPGCELCHPLINGENQTIGHLHHFAMVSVVGAGLSLPIEVEPWGPGDCEFEASQRMLDRVIRALGRRFADYVIGDGLYATAPFLNIVTELGLYAVARLKGNLPHLYQAAQLYFASRPALQTFLYGKDRVEIWDAEGFAPWEELCWERVRVMRYRQHKPDGTVVEAYWLTNFPLRLCGSRSLFHIAKSRWEIENQGFNDGKTRHGMEHIRHHHANSLLIDWLLIALALTIERLFRLRFLHRGKTTPLSSQTFVTYLLLSLGTTRPRPSNSS